MAWSAAAAALWGKTEREEGAWLPLVQHLEDTCLVAGHLWDTWLPRIVRDRASAAVGGDVRLARSLVTWLAGVHDVGKATPAFATQVYDVGNLDHVVDASKEAGLDVPHLARSQRKSFHHTVTGQAILEHWLSQTQGFSPRRAAVQVAGVVGAHHGVPLSSTARNAGNTEFRSARSAVFGGPAWRAAQVEILETMSARADVLPALAVVGRDGLPLTVQMDLTAIVIVADWLASDSKRFPYDLSASDDERWQRGRASLDLAAPWEPLSGLDDPQQLMEARFPHLMGRPVNAVQRAAFKVAEEVNVPPLLVIEAPMGHGKTEAALLAAEKLAERFGAGGVFFGLPTMATSDGMFGRVLTWLEHGVPGTRPSVHLAHSKAILNEQYRGLLSSDLSAKGVYDDEDGPGSSPVVNQWTRGRKKGVLASVVVGTIDQVLFAGLQTKHLALRHLALTGKVVVVDEVHAADDYMRAYLCRVLEWLGRYGTPVVLMSATLPSSQRQQLVDAYVLGRGGEPADVTADTGYPRITSVAAGVTTTTVPSAGDPHRVEVRFVDHDVTAIARRVVEEIDEGGCAAAIVNTVRRAQELYAELVGVLPEDEVVLVHSRFIGPHRMAKEKQLRDALGPTSQGRQRPRRLVVVGTQVLEQSLDVDFDVMVTDIAPIDLVLQRAGRLHRHQRPPEARPAGLRSARLFVAGCGIRPDLEEMPQLDASAVAVYRTHKLLRATEMLIRAAGEGGLRLPHDIPRMVEAAYDDSRPAPHAWHTEWVKSAAADAKRRVASVAAAASFQLPPVHQQGSMVNLLPAMVAESDDLERTGRAQVRDTEDSLEVILAIRDDDGLIRVPPGVDCGGRAVPLVLGERDRRVARSLASCTVRLPRSLTHPGVLDRVIDELESDPVVAGWQSDPYLAGQLLVSISSDGVGEILGQRVSYDATRGLRVETAGEGASR
ncbi:MAG: CRISPR-associated helicase/endonuclease Cas3 [Kytococcus sp.]|nr:CRISPR-associated helicase/endonuclease Cas3 [Kytococcus sp.]